MTWPKAIIEIFGLLFLAFLIYACSGYPGLAR